MAVASVHHRCAAFAYHEVFWIEEVGEVFVLLLEKDNVLPEEVLKPLRMKSDGTSGA